MNNRPFFWIRHIAGICRFSLCLTLLILGSEPSFGQDGTVDITFNPGTDVDYGAEIFCLDVQTNGQILVGGSFTKINGESRNRIARINLDGGLDADFVPLEGPDNRVWAVSADQNGSVLIGGEFQVVNTIQRNRFARLRSDGSLDMSFPSVDFNQVVTSITKLADGKILVLGGFNTVNGKARKNVAKLLSNGSLDLEFNPGSKVVGNISATLFLPDGKIIIAGGFTSVDGINRTNIARVDSMGNIDTTFDAGYIDGAVTKLALQPDGQILIVGDFKTVNGYSRMRVARLLPDGTVDAKFVFLGGVDLYVYQIGIDNDSRVYLVGAFSYSYAGTSRRSVVRLNSDGRVDPSFYPRVNGHVYAYAMQPDRKVIIGGAFQTVNDSSLNGIARLNNANSANAEAIFLNVALYPGMFISGAVGSRHRIEFTTNLNLPTQWLPMTTITLSNVAQQVFDPQSSSSGTSRFYRSVSLP